MSNTQYAFLDSVRVPDCTSLQASIDALGFDLQLHPDLKLLEDSGYSPCVLHGHADAGFELESYLSEDVADGDEEFLAIADGRDQCIAMIWRGSMKDCAAVMIVSCALAKYFDAVVSFGGDPAMSIEELLTGAQDALNEVSSGP
jgi:hypothetical protein